MRRKRDETSVLSAMLSPSQKIEDLFTTKHRQACSLVYSFDPSTLAHTPDRASGWKILSNCSGVYGISAFNHHLSRFPKVPARDWATTAKGTEREPVSAQANVRACSMFLLKSICPVSLCENCWLTISSCCSSSEACTSSLSRVVSIKRRTPDPSPIQKILNYDRVIAFLSREFRHRRTDQEANAMRTTILFVLLHGSYFPFRTMQAMCAVWTVSSS